MISALAALVLAASGPCPGVTAEGLSTEQQQSACSLAALPSPPVDLGADRARLKAILDRPEFAHARSTAGQALLEAWNRFWEWLKSLLLQPGTQSAASGARIAVLALASIAFVVLALRLARMRRDRKRGAPSSGPSAPLGLEEPSVHRSRAWAALPSAPREAIREGLLLLLSELERRRYARPDRVKTNRELATELPRRGAPAELTRTVESLIAWYDQTFYSLEEVPGDEARRFLLDVDAALEKPK